MSATTGAVLLHAKQLEMADLKALHTRAMLAGMAGHLIHCLQSERGASSIYIASNGQRFRRKLHELIGESKTITDLLLTSLNSALTEPSLANRKIANQMAWALLGLEAMESVRTKIAALQISGNESVTAYSQLIDVLINFIFELVDTSVNPIISKLLVSLFSLVEGKEAAGQERAIGALAFASGHCDPEQQFKLTSLKENQDRNFETFVQFCEPDVSSMLASLESLESKDAFLALRHRFASLKPNNQLDTELSDLWFNCCSDRISKLWSIQQVLVNRIQTLCSECLEMASEKLESSEELIDRFLHDSDTLPADPSLFFHQHSLVHQNSNFRLNPNPRSQWSSHTLYDLVQQQSSQLAKAESELQAARRTLAERKVIERAKGILMAKMNINEEAAHKELRCSAMRHNQRLVDIAEVIQSMNDWPGSLSSR